MNPGSVIPRPNQMTMEEGVFHLTPGCHISCEPGGEFAAGLLKKLTGFEEGEAPAIRFTFDRAITATEGYTLSINPEGVDIKAGTPAGLLYGAETLRQLLPPGLEKAPLTDEATLPCLRIEDAPRFEYRGFMLDVSRHFFGVETIKRLLDRMALLKLNRFHWHLSDSQGWRVQSEQYPELTEIGSKREGTLVYGWLLGKKQIKDEIYEGYYTKEQIREVVAYAKERGIEVIPEIDLPGHAIALLSSLPGLSCTGQPLKPATGEHPANDLVCAGKESTYPILFGILDEIVELFPFKTFHIGGDEADKSSWKRCPDCQKKMKELGLKNENELQGYFMNRIAEHLLAKGCRVICWNDGLSKAALPELICQYWIFFNKKETVRQVREGRKVIYSYVRGYYLDYAYHNFGLENSYSLGAGEREFGAAGAKNVIGVEAPLWSEMVYDEDRIDWQMFPRILAAAESAWTDDSLKDYNDFLSRLPGFEGRLDAMNIHHATKDCYLKEGRKGLLGYLATLLPGDHPAMREYRKFNRVTGYNKTDGRTV